MTITVDKKMNEVLFQLCQDLNIPYDPRSGKEPDPRVYAISNALSWLAEFAVEDYKSSIK